MRNKAIIEIWKKLIRNSNFKELFNFTENDLDLFLNTYDDETIRRIFHNLIIVESHLHGKRSWAERQKEREQKNLKQPRKI